MAELNAFGATCGDSKSHYERQRPGARSHGMASAAQSAPSAAKGPSSRTVTPPTKKRCQRASADMPSQVVKKRRPPQVLRLIPARGWTEPSTRVSDTEDDSERTT